MGSYILWSETNEVLFKQDPVTAIERIPLLQLTSVFLKCGYAFIAFIMFSYTPIAQKMLLFFYCDVSNLPNYVSSAFCSNSINKSIPAKLSTNCLLDVPRWFFPMTLSWILFLILMLLSSSPPILIFPTVTKLYPLSLTTHSYRLMSNTVNDVWEPTNMSLSCFMLSKDRGNICLFQNVSSGSTR